MCLLANLFAELIQLCNSNSALTHMDPGGPYVAKGDVAQDAPSPESFNAFYCYFILRNITFTQSKVSKEDAVGKAVGKELYFFLNETLRTKLSLNCT